MSTAAAADGAAPAKAGKKKLIIALALLLLLAAVAGGGMLWWLKARSQAAHADDDAAAELSADGAAAPQRRDPKAVPVFIALDNFTVNLADRDAERYAQIGISLELADNKAGDRIKAFMPAIRNNVLMVLAHKQSSELLERAGKEKLAGEVLRETERALGLEPLPADSPKRRHADADARPVRAVHFANFIIQ
jgi:flagellar FliL protein